MSTPDVICVGEALVEMVKVELDSPHQELGTYEGPFASGAPAIFASSAGRLGRAHGISAGFIGSVGADPFGDAFVNKLSRDGLVTDAIKRSPDNATGAAFVQLNSDGSRSFVFSQGAAADFSEADLSPEYFSGVQALHISGSSLSLNAKLRDTCMKALDLALLSNPSCIVTFDPNFRIEMADPEETREWAKPVLSKTTHLLPSGDELKFLTGESELAGACGSAFASGSRLSCIVLKQGPDGCHLQTRDTLANGGSHVPGVAANERYPTGAGDNFGGALLVGVLAGLSLEDAARAACAAGALAVEEKGLMKTFSWQDVQAKLNA